MPAPPYSAAPSVRMYRQGLGDCFLVTLPREVGRPFHCLIDCGVLLGTPNAESLMNSVARDISIKTGGYLDVVVVTHEHWDHVSGFLQAKAVFDAMEIGEVWLAWTEDPADQFAGQLRERRRQAKRGLRVVANRMRAASPALATPLHNLLNLFGTASGPTTRDAFDYLINHPSRPRIRYLRPSENPIPISNLNGATAYVLGPPCDEKMLRRDEPSKTYNDVYALASGTAIFAASGGLSSNDGGLAETHQAFDSRYRVAVDQAQELEIFRDRYFRLKDNWRRIDDDWLTSGQQLAIALDNHTNNTSLVLALELGVGGRVLLFPGDAQLGNWLSWDDCVWPPNCTGDTAVTAADLLRRTVLYKVGHHASHNATLREKGLERMIHPDMVAMIPVNNAAAARMRWKMPFPALFSALLKRTHGKVLQADVGIPERPEGVSIAEWAEFTNRIAVDPGGLFIECSIITAAIN